MRRIFELSLGCIAGAALCFLSLHARAADNSVSARAADASQEQPKILTEAQGQNLSDIAIGWGRWVMSAPDRKDPWLDDTGRDCALRQSGSVWYLAGSWRQNMRVVRRCAIPEGKYIAAPVDVSIQRDSPAQADYGSWSICGNLLSSVKIIAGMDSARDLMLEVDGRKRTDFSALRADSKYCFKIPHQPPAPADDIEHIYAADGYWAVLPPLGGGII